MNPMEEILLPNTTTSSKDNINNLTKPSSSFERRVRPQKAAAAVNCPRCDSTNTKFCYYNNYSLSQPRYFCKSCRRYWTEGGTLRNIPVGGGSRKNKRSSSSSSSSTTSSNHPSNFPYLVSQNPRIHHDQYGQDLNLGFPSTNSSFKNVAEFIQIPNFDAARNMNNLASSTCGSLVHQVCPTASAQLSALEGTPQNSFVPISNSVYTPSGQLLISMPEFKIPSVSFSLDGMGSGGGGGGSGNLLFPFEEMKTGTSIAHDGRQSKDDQNCDSNGFWNGMMGGGSCVCSFAYNFQMWLRYGYTRRWRM